MQKERRLTGTLSRPNRLVVSVCAGLEADEAIINETTRWSNRLEADAQRWLLRGGLASPRHLTKADAYRLFAHELGGVRK